MWLEYLRTALERFFTYKLITVLAIVGIAVASATFVATFAIGSNARVQIMKDVQELGTNLVFIRSIRTPTTRLPWVSRLDLSLQDMGFLRENVRNIRDIAPHVFYDDVLRAGRQKLLKRVDGTTAACKDIQNITMKYGRFLNETDEKLCRNVCLVDTEIAKEIFAADNPIGQTLMIGNNIYRIVGVMNTKLQSTYFDVSAKIIIPISTLQRNRNLGNKVDSISISANAASQAPAMVEDVSRKLEAYHGEKNFTVWCQEVFLRQRDRIASIFQLLMISLALISIMVGGIGIMNIMLISVKDRIKEIGIRRSVGATREGIIIQFLLEAVLLTVSGGLIGILVGSLIGRGLTKLLSLFLGISVEWSTIWSPTILVISFLFAFVTGLLSGLYPAIKASKIQPVEALRHE
jgi:putative ABC transport system permease protein